MTRPLASYVIFVFVAHVIAQFAVTFVSRPVFKRLTVGYFVVEVSIVVFSLFATFSGT